jgi:small conductance mechanosensitive channel
MQEAKIKKLIEHLDWSSFVEFGLIVAGAIAVIKISSWLLPKAADPLPGRLRLRILSLVPVVRLTTIILSIVLIVPIFVPPTPENLIAMLGASGIAIGFALKDYVSSLLAGIVTLIEQPYKPGDWIKIGDHYGEVISIGLRSVTLVTPDDNAVIVPHMKIWTEPLINSNTGHPELQCVADIFVHPKHDGAAVRLLLKNVGLTSPYVQLQKPIVVVAAEKPWGTHYRLKAYPVDARDQFLFSTDMTLRAKEALIAKGIEFAAQPIASVQATSI